MILNDEQINELKTKKSQPFQAAHCICDLLDTVEAYKMRLNLAWAFGLVFFAVGFVCGFIGGLPWSWGK